VGYRFNRKYRVLKEDDITKHLSDDEQWLLSEIEATINEGRRKDGKTDNVYLVINTDVPYAKQVAEIMVAHGYCAKAGDEDVIEVD
jgi:hypothetical protein